MGKTLFILAVLLAPISALASGSYTAVSCNQADVNAVINGPTHTAVDGDIINVPGTACTWTSGVTVPANIGIQIIGPGQANLTITDNYTAGAMIKFQPQFGNSTTRLSGIKIIPQPATLFNFTGVPVLIVGTCTASGCPNVRVDHITFPSSWSGIQVKGDEVIWCENCFGVLDDNTVGDVLGSGNGVFLVGVSHGSWQGIGNYGDNSWFSADSFGTNQALYIENNIFNYAAGNDTDSGDTTTNVGGGRVVCRFNTFNFVTGGGACGNHGTESSARPRGGRSIEFYGNTTISAANGSVDALVGYRSGTGFTFGNTYTASGFALNKFVSIASYREWQTDAFCLCIVGPYDVQDGRATAYSGTISSTGSNTITVSGTPFTANAFNFSTINQTGNYYYVFDETTGQEAGITSNTSSQLTYGWNLLAASYSGTLGAGTFNPGDSIVVMSTTIYAAGTHTGSNGASILADISKTWTGSQWVSSGDAYSVLDVSTGHAYQIGANTTNTASAFSAPSPAWTWSTGDSYVFLRDTVCLDQGTAGFGGQLLSGTVPTIGSTTQGLDPLYEWDDKESGGSPTQSYTVSGSLNVTANRNYYTGGSNAAQSSPTSPFSGASGVGFGTLANRPTTCTAGVAYFATDQGSWNTSGNGFGQGELFQCSATNTWSLYYTPYTYPHPLDINSATNAITSSGVTKQGIMVN